MPLLQYLSRYAHYLIFLVSMRVGMTEIFSAPMLSCPNLIKSTQPEWNRSRIYLIAEYFKCLHSLKQYRYKYFI